MSGLRVVGGVAKGRRLRMVPGDSTRPIGDRVKVALFNIVGPDIEGAWLLDLFAGTGGVGIEALSRGAQGAIFVENEPRAVETVQANLAATGLAARAEVLRADAFALLQRKPHRRVDYVYVAPPQYQDLWSRAVAMIDSSPDWLNPDAWVIAQIDPREYRQLTLARLLEFDRRKYGSTLLVFYEHPGS